MTLEPARIHGRTFLQKALCREIFHRDDSNNSVFSVNYNFSGGNICGGGFFGGVLGGLAYGAGAALMGKTLSWLNGGSSGSAFGFPALTMPTFGFPSFGFPSFSQFSSFGGFTPFSSQISSFWGGGAGNSSSTLGSTTSTAAPASTTSSAKVKDTPKDKEEKKTDKAKIKELKAKYKELKNSKDRGEAFQQDLTKLYNDLRAIQNPNWRVRRLIKNVEKLAAENNLNIIQQAKEKTEPVKEEALTIAESVQKAQSMDDLLVILDNNEYDKLIETDKKSFNEKFDKYLNNMKLKDVEDLLKEENLPNELKNKAVVKKDVLSNNDDEIKEQLSPQLQEIEYPAPTEEKDKAKAQPQQPGQPDAASPVAKKDDKAAAVKPADEQDETEEPEELEEPAQPEVKVKPDKEPEDKIAAAATQKQTEAANAKQEVEDAFGKVKLNDNLKTNLKNGGIISWQSYPHRTSLTLLKPTRRHIATVCGIGTPMCFSLVCTIIPSRYSFRRVGTQMTSQGDCWNERETNGRLSAYLLSEKI